MSEGRIGLLSTDYDGTLSPLDSTREDSKLPAPLDAVLRSIAGRTKLAVITSKSFDFIHVRIPYAHAWGCVGGLDIRFMDGSELTTAPGVDVDAGLKKAKAMLGAGVDYEEKRGSGTLLGFSVDWRGRPPPSKLEEAIDELKQDGFYIDRDISNPFVDFLCSRPDKGTALARIKAGLSTSGLTMFIGDSPTDNPAFREADVAVGVDHGQPLSALEYDFVVHADGVRPLLEGLLARDMEFGAILPKILRK